MSATALQFRSEAERRQLSDRRRVCLLDYAYRTGQVQDLRSGFDRRDLLKIPCPSCHAPLFGNRNRGRRLILAMNFVTYIRDAELGEPYLCPHCETRYDKQALLQQQDLLRMRRTMGR